MTPSYRAIHSPIAFGGGGETLLFGTIARRLGIHKVVRESERLDLDPEYQRGHVWTEEQQENFVGHMLEGGASPIIIINRDKAAVNDDQIVDGKQRLTAIANWLEDKVAAKLSDGRRVMFSDFSSNDQRIILGVCGPHLDCGYVTLSRPEVMRLYLRLNRGGTVHSTEELNRVRALLEEL